MQRHQRGEKSPAKRAHALAHRPKTNRYNSRHIRQKGRTGCGGKNYDVDPIAPKTQCAFDLPLCQSQKNKGSDVAAKLPARCANGLRPDGAIPNLRRDVEADTSQIATEILAMELLIQHAYARWLR